MEQCTTKTMWLELLNSKKRMADLEALARTAKEGVEQKKRDKEAAAGPLACVSTPIYPVRAGMS